MKRFFVSYAWGAERETGVVNEIEVVGKSRGLQIIRDNIELKYGDSISEYMAKMSAGRQIIIVLSEDYFLSKWCAYELLLISLKDDCQEKMKPIVVDDCREFSDAHLDQMLDSLMELYGTRPELFESKDGFQAISDADQFRTFISIYLKRSLLFFCNTPIPTLKEFRKETYSQIFGPHSSPAKKPFSLDELQESISQELNKEELFYFAQAIRLAINPILQENGLEQVESGLEVQPLAEKLGLALVVGLIGGGKDCTIITRGLNGAIESCFEESKDKSPAFLGDTQRELLFGCVTNILGYMLMSTVKLDLTETNKWNLDLSGLFFEVGLLGSGSIELVLARHLKHPAELELDDDGVYVESRYLIMANLSQFSWQKDEKINELTSLIWETVMYAPRDVRRQASVGESKRTFTESDLDYLRANLNTYRTNKNPRHYAVAIKFDEDDKISQEACKNFLEKLEIPLVRYKVEQESDNLIFNEASLMSAVRDFFLELERYR